MTTMIERVARAMFEASRKYAALRGVQTSWDMYPLKNAMLDMARAAIGAMREPTDATAQAGVDADHTLEAIEGRPDYPESCANIYRAMIDAALNEQVSG